MNAAHHLDRSRLYLGFAARNVRAGEYDRAARAVHRAASHAVTAAASIGINVPAVGVA